MPLALDLPRCQQQPSSASGMGGADPHYQPLLGGPQAKTPKGRHVILTFSLDWFQCPQARGWVPLTQNVHRHEWSVEPASTRASRPQSLIPLTLQTPDSQDVLPGHLPERTLKPTVTQLHSQCPLLCISWTLRGNPHPMTLQSGTRDHSWRHPAAEVVGGDTKMTDLSSPGRDPCLPLAFSPPIHACSRQTPIQSSGSKRAEDLGPSPVGGCR